MISSSVLWTSNVLITFQRRTSKKLHQVAFECGEDNVSLILKEGWNTNSIAVKAEPWPQADDLSDEEMANGMAQFDAWFSNDMKPRP